MKPTKKSSVIKELLDSLAGRTEAIEHDRCINKPIGCGRKISKWELLEWEEIELIEYTISGLCNKCQKEIFKE